jgi:hypothetical protein
MRHPARVRPRRRPGGGRAVGQLPCVTRDRQEAHKRGAHSSTQHLIRRCRRRSKQRQHRSGTAHGRAAAAAAERRLWRCPSSSAAAPQRCAPRPRGSVQQHARPGPWRVQHRAGGPAAEMRAQQPRAALRTPGVDPSPGTRAAERSSGAAERGGVGLRCRAACCAARRAPSATARLRRAPCVCRAPRPQRRRRSAPPIATPERCGSAGSQSLVSPACNRTAALSAVCYGCPLVCSLRRRRREAVGVQSHGQVEASLRCSNLPYGGRSAAAAQRRRQRQRVHWCRFILSCPIECSTTARGDDSTLQAALRRPASRL